VRLNRGFLSIVAVILSVIVLFTLIIQIGGALNENLALDETRTIRFRFVAIGLAILLMVYLFTRHHPIWVVKRQHWLVMAVGAILYALFSWILGGAVFTVPSVSQVSLRPAIVIPIFVGYAFGPAAGFFTGAVGNMLGDAFSGFALSPQWGIGNGLIGLIAGMPNLVPRQKKAINLALAASIVLAGVATAVFLQNRSLPNLLFFDPNAGVFGDATISIFAGLSSVIGLILVLLVRFAYAENLSVISAIVWGMFANFVGLGFAALSDIWINEYSPAVAIVGEFLPAAGPNLIFAAILTPIFVSGFEALRKTGAQPSPPPAT
jgi:hypothetical protein